MDKEITTLLDRAVSAAKQGRLAESMDLFRRLLAADPGNFDALHGMGIVLGQMGNFDEGLGFIEQACDIRPQSAHAYFNRGLTLNKLRRYQEALASFDRAISLQPDHAGAYFNRGITLQERERYEDAVTSYDRAISLRPDFTEALFSRGNVFQELRRYEDAVTSYDRTIALRPTLAEAHFNRGNALRNLRRYDDALAAFDRAISLRPDYVKAIYNKSLLLLLLGNYGEGWPLHEWRWKEGPMQKLVRNLKQPLWLGDRPLAGKTILLYFEQGLGDVIQFVRYAPMVSALGAEVILEVPPSLVSLLRTLEGTYTFITHGDRYPDFDLHCPLMSLPLAFKTTLSTIPASSSYLYADPQKARPWARRLQDFQGLRVGLVWAGRAPSEVPNATAIDARRSLHLSSFAPLRHVPGVHYFSLQKGPSASQLDELRREGWPGPEIIDYTEELNDWADTAALMENLDLVISCDTSTAHLAGAMGKPTWILNRYDGCWRWLVDREDSPWYPSVRLFRQEQSDDWSGIMSRIRSELLRLERQTERDQ
jgi:tetratricopeptide (TPR) repeat protein